MLRPLVLLTAAALVLSGCAPGAKPAAESDRETAVAQSTEQPTVVGSAPLQSQSVETAATEPGFVPLLAVGDIASCDTTGDEQVAKLAREREGRIAILGDAVYDDGTRWEFNNCFDPAWGSMAARFRPALGNHEYRTAGAEPYWDYFGDFTGRRGKGWYAYNLGEHWRAIVLNTNCAQVGGCGMDSPQGRWLKGAIERAGDRHIVAYWHQPLYSTGHHGGSPFVRPFFRALYRGGAKIVLNGHDHIYERFAPQNHRGERRRGGVQQFVVGTGGFRHYTFSGPPHRNTRVRNNDSFGLLKLRLRPNGYSWDFVPSEGGFTDSGSRSLD